MPQATEITVQYVDPTGPHTIAFTAPSRLKFREIFDELGQRIDLDHCTVQGIKQNATKEHNAMRLELTIDSQSDAFANGEARREAARLLRETADRIEQGSDYGVLRDSDGKPAGDWEASA